jgi:hypothetical protein
MTNIQTRLRIYSALWFLGFAALVLWGTWLALIAWLVSGFLAAMAARINTIMNIFQGRSDL